MGKGLRDRGGPRPGYWAGAGEQTLQRGSHQLQQATAQLGIVTTSDDPTSFLVGTFFLMNIIC